MDSAKIKAGLILIGINIVLVLMLVTNGEMFTNIAQLKENNSFGYFGIIVFENIGLNILNLAGIGFGVYEYFKSKNPIGRNVIWLGIAAFFLSLIFI